MNTSLKIEFRTERLMMSNHKLVHKWESSLDGNSYKVEEIYHVSLQLRCTDTNLKMEDWKGRAGIQPQTRAQKRILSDHEREAFGRNIPTKLNPRLEKHHDGNHGESLKKYKARKKALEFEDNSTIHSWKRFQKAMKKQKMQGTGCIEHTKDQKDIKKKVALAKQERKLARVEKLLRTSPQSGPVGQVSKTSPLTYLPSNSG